MPAAARLFLLDEFSHPSLVDCLDDVLRGLDLVGQLADLGRGKGVVGPLGGAVAFVLEVGDVVANLLVERGAQILEAILLALLALDRTQLVCRFILSPSRRGRVPSGTRQRTRVVTGLPRRP